jgi:hypothetical protein
VRERRGVLRDPAERAAHVVDVEPGPRHDCSLARRIRTSITGPSSRSKDVFFQ